MQVGIFELLQAKQAEIDAGRDYVESLRDYWIARTELEKAIGGGLKSASPTSRLAAPSEQPHESEHQHHHGD